jgi:hypothetical protein
MYGHNGTSYNICNIGLNIQHLSENMCDHEMLNVIILSIIVILYFTDNMAVPASIIQVQMSMGLSFHDKPSLVETGVTDVFMANIEKIFFSSSVPAKSIGTLYKSDTKHLPLLPP